MIKTSSIRVKCLHCADCVSKIEKRISKIKGVRNLNLSFTTGQLNVTYDSKQVSLPELKERVEDMGYNVFKAELMENNIFSIYNPKLFFIIISGIALLLGLLIIFFTSDYELILVGFHFYFSELLFVIAMLFGGFYILKSAISEVLDKEFSIELLMIIAAVGAVLIGALPEAAAILFLFSIAELLESYASERSRRSINELINLAPKFVLIKQETGQKVVKVPVDKVKPGDIAVVRSGQYIGVDGQVLKGCSAVNQASITGEAMPVKKQPGDVVYAGTLNQDGRLEVHVAKYPRDTTLAKIIRLVETAEEKKSKTERFMDRFAKYYTPSILLIAALVVLIPIYIFNQSFEVWFYKALMLILISCPCALAISTPVSIVSAITHGARNGVLFKGGVHVEQAARINTVAFDKTGTLTKGKPVVIDIIPLKGHTKDEVLHIAASLECLSKHPVGDALVECAESNGVHNQCVDDFATIVGKGVHGQVNGSKYYVGDPTLFDEKALKPLAKHIQRFEAEAKTVVVIGKKAEPIGLIALADELRTDSKNMVSELNRAGIKRIVMLTGDNPQTGRKVAQQVGIKEYHTEVLPDEKVRIIKRLRANNGDSNVAMVGDGINDSPALAAADLGIAMGAAGSDTALETADVALMKDDLSKVPYMIRLGRKTMSVVKQNILLAVGIKLLFAILVFPGLVTLWMAVAIGDMGVSLGVILNALRLGRV